jgi:predicted MFS family arabinose efflux permease
LWCVSAISCLCMCLWGDRAALPLHMMHAGFTITMTIAPFLTTPFLSQNITASVNATLMNHLSVVPRELNHLPALLGDATVNRMPELESGLLGNATVTDVPMIETASRVWIPYAMIGAMGLISSIGFFVIYSLGFRYDPPLQQQSTNRSYTLRSLCRCRRENVYPVYFLCSLFILYLLNRGRINSTNLFLFPIAASPPLNFSHTLSASVNMLYSGAMVLGRVVIGALSHWLHMAPLLWIQSICLLITHILLSILALDGALQFWILSGLCGMWAGPAYPSIVAWTNSYIEVHGYVMAIIDLGIGAGTFISSWLCGYLFEYYGSAYVFYLCAAASGIVLIVLLPLQIVASKHGGRHREENE